MKKDKEWLKEEVMNLYPSHSEMYEHPDYLTVEKVDLINNFIDLIDQLDEPEVLSQEWIESNTSPVDDEGRLYIWKRDLQNLIVPKQDKPVIPQFVADWIKENRGKVNFHMFFTLKNHKHEEAQKWAMSNSGTFARAWLDGYEVEKEKKYLVKLPHESDMGLSLYLSRQFGVEWVDEETMADHITEAEIKAIDERYWAFAEEVTK